MTQLRPIRVLIIEDRVEDWLLMQRVLNGGYVCTNAQTLAVAITALKDHVFDLIVADLTLPDIAQGQQHIGVEALRRVAADLPLVVIIGELPGASACGALVRAGATTIVIKGTGAAYTSHLNVQVTAAIELERHMQGRLDVARSAARREGEDDLNAALANLTAEIRTTLAARPVDDDPEESLVEPTDVVVALGRETGGLLVRALRSLGPWGRRFLTALLASGTLGAGWWWLPLLDESCDPTSPTVEYSGDPL